MKNWNKALLLMGFLALALPAGAAGPEFVYETSVPGYTLGSGRLVAVDAAGAAIVAGAYYLDGQHLDIVVMKFSPAGTLVWVRSINGANHDYAAGIAITQDGDAWLTGWTDSPDFPLLDPMDDSLTGFRDLFLTKLSGADGSILYSTFIGGDYTDEAADIALGPGGEIYLTGATTSMDFPVTLDAVQPALNSYPYAYSDAFILRLGANADEILYGSYLGGSRDDRGKALALDGMGRVAIAGDTQSGDFPLASPLQPLAAGEQDAFVARLSADGGSLDFATYLGGSDNDDATGLAVDDTDALVVSGGTQSTDFPTTQGAFQETFAGAVHGCGDSIGGFYNCPDAWAAKLSPAGDALAYATYIGGSATDQLRDLVLDAAGNALFVGYSSSADYPPEGIGSSAAIVVTKLGADGATLEYSVTVDSPAAGAGHGIALGPGGDIYFTGAIGIPYEIYLARLAGDELVTAVPDPTAASASARLKSAFPNPFNPKTKIVFELTEVAPVDLAVFDLSGRQLRSLISGVRPAGEHEAVWDGRDENGAPLASGVYFVRLRTPMVTESGSLVLLK